MSTHRHIDAICVVIMILTLLLTILFMNGESFGLQPIVDEDAEAYEGSAYFTENDLNGAWRTGTATQIVLRGDHASVAGGGAFAYENKVMITNAGKYVVSGVLDNGSIIVDTDSTAKVWILLDGAEIRCPDSACLDIEQADKVFLSLAENTSNSLTSSGFSEQAAAAGIDGAIFSRDDLTINGAGALAVSSAAGHGIVGNDELVITGGEISVTAAADALNANDGLRITGASLTLAGGDDGIDLSGPESELYIESGTLALTASDKGFSAGNRIDIVGGTIALETGDDGISAVGEVRIEGGSLRITVADDGIHSDTAVAVSGGSVEIPSCYEGIEAVTIEVTGGDILIYPDDDGMNANGETGLFGGRPGGGMRPGGMDGMRPEGMDGMRPGGMDGRPPEAWDGSPERPEPPTGSAPPDAPGRPEPSGGPGNGEPPDMPDGPEGAAPGELPAPPEQQGMPDPAETESGTAAAGSTEAVASEETWIHISGGSVTVINDSARDADGLDSNGDIIISGGVVRVSLVNSGSNSALDCGSESGGIMEISGGNVIACGSYSMAEGFDSSSTQCAVLYNFKRGAAAGTTVSLEDSSGKVLLSYDVPCSFSSVTLSCPEMKLGETYTVVIGDSAEEITLDTVSASFGDVRSEGFGGPMNWGGMKFRPGT